MSPRAAPAPPTATSVEHAYRQHRDRLVGLAFLLCGSREVAEEAVHDVFAQAHARWASIDDPAGYLTRAVTYRIRDEHRRRYRRQQLDVPAEASTGIPEVDETWRHVCDLPEAQRAVVVLRYYADLPLDVIARLLDRPTSTVRSDHRRALDRLRRTVP